MRVAEEQREAQERSEARERLKGALRTAIQLAEACTAAEDASTQRAMKRALALLWSALDEIEAAQ
jgi:hypothetical protein